MPIREDFQEKNDAAVSLINEGCLVEAWESIEALHTEASGPDEKRMAEDTEDIFFEQEA